MSRGGHRRYDSCREHEHEWQTHTFSTDENADRMRRRLADAEAAMKQARRTGTRDRSILAHAAAIAARRSRG